MFLLDIRPGNSERRRGSEIQSSANLRQVFRYGIGEARHFGSLLVSVADLTTVFPAVEATQQFFSDHNITVETLRRAREALMLFPHRPTSFTSELHEEQDPQVLDTFPRSPSVMLLGMCVAEEVNRQGAAEATAEMTLGVLLKDPRLRRLSTVMMLQVVFEERRKALEGGSRSGLFSRLSEKVLRR